MKWLVLPVESLLVTLLDLNGGCSLVFEFQIFLIDFEMKRQKEGFVKMGWRRREEEIGTEFGIRNFQILQ